MREVIIHSVKVTNYKAPMDIHPTLNYKIGSYLDINFEVREYTGFRMQTQYNGKFSYKMTPNHNKPICRMDYDELESLAYEVIDKQFGGKNV